MQANDYQVSGDRFESRGWRSLARAGAAWRALADADQPYLFLAGTDASGADEAGRIEELLRAVSAVMAAGLPIVDRGTGEIDAPEAPSGRRPAPVERLIALFKRMHAHWQGAEGGARVQALAAVVVGDVVHVISVGDGFRLHRLDAGAVAVDIPLDAGGQPVLLGEPGTARVAVHGARLAPGDVIVATPCAAGEPESVLDALRGWHAQPDAVDAERRALDAAGGAVAFAALLAGEQESAPADASLSTVAAAADDDVAGLDEPTEEPEAWAELISAARSTVSDIALQSHAAAADESVEASTSDESLEFELGGEFDLDTPPVIEVVRDEGELPPVELEGAASPPETRDDSPDDPLAADLGLPHDGDADVVTMDLDSVDSTAVEEEPADAQAMNVSDGIDAWLGDDSVPLRVAFDDDEAASYQMPDASDVEPVLQNPPITAAPDPGVERYGLVPPAEDAGPPPLDGWAPPEDAGGTPASGDADVAAEDGDPLANWFAPAVEETTPPPLPETFEDDSNEASKQIFDKSLRGSSRMPLEPAGPPFGEAAHTGGAPEPQIEAVGAGALDTESDAASFQAGIDRTASPGDAGGKPKRSSRGGRPWMMRRRRGGASLRPALIAMGIASAIIGAITVLGLTGGLNPIAERFARLKPGAGTSASSDVLLAPVSYRISSLPQGAEVWIDGQATGVTTPVPEFPLTPGSHEVELRLASLGSWTTTLTVEPGSSSGNTVFAALTGSIAARTDRLVPDVRVQLDGQPVGEAPVVMDSVAAGRHVVSFRGPGAFTWEEEVQVRIDATSEVVASLEGVESLSLVTVRSAQETASGVAHRDGDEVWVDGESRGVTPADVYLTAGRHAIEVRRDSKTRRRVIEVRAADRVHIDLRLDRMPGIRIRHEPPSTIAVSGTPLLQIELLGQTQDRYRKAHAHVCIAGTWQELALGPIPGARDAFIVALPVSSAHAGQELRYYFSSEDAAGEVYYTPIYSVPLQ